MASQAPQRVRPLLSMTVTKPNTSVRRSQRLGHGAKAAALAAAPGAPVPTPKPAPADDLALEPPPKKARTTKRAPAAPAEEPPLLTREESALCTTLQQPKLPFDLDMARAFLCDKDPRFEPLFQQLDLKMYNELRDGELKELNLFRVLTTSILGQQISWLAARSINYKFCRTFAPHLDEQPDFGTLDREKLPFPTPHDILDASDEQLRSAGLSNAKVKYVRDLARRFADGRLDVRRIVHMSHDECIDELTQVKGVGRWTAEMMLMFALRFPDVLPVGDLGVQRGMVYFYTSGAQGPVVSDRKKKQDAVLPVEPTDAEAMPLPSANLSHATLRSRAQGNKTKKNMYLDAHEMEELAAPWAPYRSVASMFMWSLVDN